MAAKLPIAIIIPHGGLAIPPELEGRVALTPEQIFNEADSYVDDIFSYQDRVLHWMNFPYARGILDVNRPDDATLHHRLGDGAVKLNSSYGLPVFKEGQEPDLELVNTLISKYWRPWHEKITAIVDDPDVKLIVDCHSMAAVGPAAYDDPSALRPRVSASNLGNEWGERRESWGLITAPPAATRFFGERLGDLLANIPDLTESGAPYAINAPYLGGWAMRVYGGAFKPWLMVELSRGLYIGKQDSNTPVVPPNQPLLKDIGARVWQAIEEVLALID